MKFDDSDDNASARTARALRRRILAGELRKSARLRAEAGITATTAEPTESEEATLERWGRVAGR